MSVVQKSSAASSKQVGVFLKVCVKERVVKVVGDLDCEWICQ